MLYGFFELRASLPVEQTVPANGFTDFEVER